MKVKQFEYKPLAHYSYAILSKGEIALIDPERDPSQYYAFAKANQAKIVAIIQTHPHADFVSSHLQIHQETGATIYNSQKLGADYPYTSFDEGDEINLGDLQLVAIDTPGHSPDSISIYVQDAEAGVLFTGDCLFIGDVGRPDLREESGNMQAKREELAEMMYHTIKNKFEELPDDTLIYPAHGAGSLCGKSMSDANSSTLGAERQGNWAFKEQSKQEFIDTLLDGQPFIPSYFSYDVELNKTGAPSLNEALSKIPFQANTTVNGLIVDVRDEANFKKGHLPQSINIMAISKNAKFETWLGAIVKPEEPFTLVLDSKENKEDLLNRVAKIGYEQQLEQAITLTAEDLKETPALDLEHFKNHPDAYTIVDIRNQSEIAEGKVFETALAHPLNELRQSWDQIPTDRPIVVHCAGGYRSAAGSSILQAKFPDIKVYDLSDDIKKFQNQ
ncbi:MBL fold metallo-hydrolase [Nonlabens xiamenensis]|uniref:MBL fold metallo-hydrolase n=1 Tax=Nonlabens xiamenensis TaxID=2341043 RepID=UPI000F605704|nr:rhodanese-like domain-containing protein [Nonlabens xiamenensis]